MAGSSVETGSRDPAHRGIRGSVAWRLVAGTVRACLRYRVTGLAAEAAFFAILSLPPLIFGLAGSLGYVAGIFGADTVTEVKQAIIDLARQALTEESVQDVIAPTLDAVLSRGRADVISVGFVLALWSGSRALNVFIDTITIMYGMGGKRGIIKTRALSFSLYIVALGIGIVVLPLVLAGPKIVRELLPDRVAFLGVLYWPIVVILSTVFVAGLYHVAVPIRKSWRHGFAGAILVLVIWVGGAYVLRWALANASGGTSIYGPLAAPIALLLWLYVISIAVLIGAAFNSAVDRVWHERAAAAKSRGRSQGRAREPSGQPGPPAGHPGPPSGRAGEQSTQPRPSPAGPAAQNGPPAAKPAAGPAPQPAGEGPRRQAGDGRGSGDGRGAGEAGPDGGSDSGEPATRQLHER